MLKLLDDYATTSSLDKRLSKKSDLESLGDLIREFADFKDKLSPLFESKFLLATFIEQIRKAKMIEMNSKDFNRKIEQIFVAIKDQQKNSKGNLDDLAMRVSQNETVIEQTRDELLELKLQVKERQPAPQSKG